VDFSGDPRLLKNVGYGWFKESRIEVCGQPIYVSIWGTAMLRFPSNLSDGFRCLSDVFNCLHPSLIRGASSRIPQLMLRNLSPQKKIPKDLFEDLKAKIV